MEKLSSGSYVWKCVLGGEVLYGLCLMGAFLPIRNTQGSELHRALFETLPGFTWLTTGSIWLGALYVLIFSALFGWYYVWMHNSSLIAK